MATDNCKIASYTHNDIIISDRNWFVPDLNGMKRERRELSQTREINVESVTISGSLNVRLKFDLDNFFHDSYN